MADPQTKQLRVALYARVSTEEQREGQTIDAQIAEIERFIKDKGWVVEGRIPWEAFKPTGGRPKPGDRWKFALCRFDYSVAFDRPELSSSAPLTQADFHRYEDYGELTFVK